MSRVVQNYNELIGGRLPDGVLETLIGLLEKHQVILRITRKRASKLGDFRSPKNDQQPRISINEDLNKYAFLITLTHEIAHLLTWKSSQHRPTPHGAEWMKAFRQLLQPFLKKEFLPSGLLEVLQNYLKNPKATSCTDPALYRELKRYDPKTEFVLLEDAMEKTLFLINSRVFIKGKRLRKRFRCMEVKTGREYLVNPVAEVKIVEN